MDIKKIQIFSGDERYINTLVKLKDGVSDTPIIFIHPIGGTLFFYKTLISRLKTTCAIYGIQDNFLENQFKKYNTLLEQAKHYIQTIFDQINTPSLIFAGHSSGGMLAFEMAKQCIDYGIDVKKVIMFDTWVTTPYDDKFKQYFQKIILRQVDRLGMTYILNNESLKKRWLELIWERMHLFFPYNPSNTPVSIILFTAKETVPEYKVNSMIHYDWSKLVQSIISIPVAGNHETMFNQEYIDQLSNEVNKYL